MADYRNVMKYADASMFEAAPMEAKEPEVHLLWMTPDPLGAIAAACRMYEGKPTYDLAEITEDERWHYAEQVQQTHLQAPLEFVKFHFFIEGIHRSITHQMVRQRTAVFAQESLRFAVKNNLASEVVPPPSIVTGSASVKDTFSHIMASIEEAYNSLIANGVPAEDAREILPHATPTRLHYCTDLRNLKEHSGNRLCTQAQFAWRAIFSGIVGAIKEHSEQGANLVSMNLFKPVCYQLGHCPFTASFDRGCTIRNRVQAFAARGVPSREWLINHSFGDRDDVDGFEYITGIRPEEWAYDPKAAWQ